MLEKGTCIHSLHLHPPDDFARPILCIDNDHKERLTQCLMARYGFLITRSHAPSHLIGKNISSTGIADINDHTRCAPRHKYSYDHKKKTQEMEGGRYKKLTFMLYHASNHCSTIRCPLLLILLPLRTHTPVHLFKLPNTFAMAYKLNHSNLCHNDDATVISFDKWLLHPLFVSTDAFLWPLLQRSGWRMS